MILDFVYPSPRESSCEFTLWRMTKDDRAVECRIRRVATDASEIRMLMAQGTHCFNLQWSILLKTPADVFELAGVKQREFWARGWKLVVEEEAVGT